MSSSNRERNTTARRRALALFSAAVFSAAVGYGTSRTSTSEQASRPTIATREAIGTLENVQLIAANDQLLLVSYDSTGNSCGITGIDPATLRLSPTVVSSCNSRQVQGEGEGVWPDLVTNMSMYGNVRIATAIKGSNTAFRLGPDVMAYANISGGARPEWTYGDGYLWIYDVGPKAGQGGGASLLRVSATTGTVEARVPMPSLYRPIMAVNDDGLWMGASPGELGGAVLYRISQHATRAQTFKLSGNAFDGIFATGSDVYLETSSYAENPRFWHLHGPSAAVVATAPANRKTTVPGFADSDGRLWSVVAAPKEVGSIGTGVPTQFDIVVDQVNPSTGDPITSTSLDSGVTTQGDAWDSVFLGEDVYLLNPALSEELFKVSL